MAGDTLDIDSIVLPDNMGTEVARFFQEWVGLRTYWMAEVEETRKYIFATDTTTTTNAKLPWKNKTTIPKLCQIRDNLFANYIASLFPKRKWLKWLADGESDNTLAKKNAIEGFMQWVIDQPSFKGEMTKLILDYIDSGNCFATIVWVDDRQFSDDDLRTPKGGYVGPGIRRIAPQDIVFNPIASNFERSPKIIRSLLSFGEVKKIVESFSTDETMEVYKKLWDYLKNLRQVARSYEGEWSSKNEYLRVDGFSSYQAYLNSGQCEILTFYGDMYDVEKDEFHQNVMITVVDRHKVIDIRPNPSFFANAPIFHAGWRVRQDNLWAMGPLANLVGMQYRIDHIENLKADVFDLIAFPVLKIAGLVEEFKWEPGARIHVSDEGNVEMVIPPFQILQANNEIAGLAAMMEEMAGAPKEAMGFRSPGEKTKYEVQRLENAASRIFQSKTSQFEEQFVERVLNGMLELSRRNMESSFSIRVFDKDLDFATFKTLTVDDITGVGRIRPIAARHFAERAEAVQSINQLFSSPLGQMPNFVAHWSMVKMSKFFEDMFDLHDYNLTVPYIGLSEQADAARQMQSHEEQVMMEGQIPSGMSQDDTDLAGMVA